MVAVPLPARLYFGWVVAASAFAVLTIAYGLQFSYGVFMPSMTADLGWDRATLSAPFSLFVLLYTWLSLAAGRLTDRFGPRVVISVGALGLGAGYALLGTTTARWEPYLFLGGLAAIGASVAFVPCNATVIRWFVRRRGLALGIASSGVSAAAAIGPPIAGALIVAVGWRTALVVMGIAGGGAMLAAAQAMVRDPETLGLAPDGRAGAAPAATAADGWTLREAQGTGAFWLLIAALSCTWIVVFLPFVHLGAYGLDQGLSALDAATLLSAIGVGGLTGRVVSGGLTDRFGRIPGLVAALVLQSSAFLGFAASHHFPSLAAWAFAYGFGYSGVSVLFPALLGDLFGRTHAGSITGFAFALGGGAAAVGPYAAGLLFDATGRYDVAFVASSVLNSLALLLLAFLRPPRRSGTSRRAPG